MSNDFRPSIFPPNVPIPDPPGAKLLARIPIYLIGFGFLIYLTYNIYLEAIDWSILRQPKPPVVSEIEPPPFLPEPPSPLDETLPESLVEPEKRPLPCKPRGCKPPKKGYPLQHSF